MTEEQPPQQPTSPPPPPPPPPTERPGGVYYSGPIPPEIRVRGEGFWSSVGRTAANTLVISSLGCLGILAAGFFLIVAAGVLIGSLIDEADDGGDDDALQTEFLAGRRSSDDQLLVLRVDGIIMGEKLDEPLFDTGFAYGYEIKEQLYEAAEEEDIKGVLLWLSTPGGTIFGSHAIADGVRYYQETTGRPVVAFVSGLSASGGMYGMAPADLILADHGSLIGSIGVIFGPIDYYDSVIATEGGLFGGGVTTTGGITREYITAGRGKDAGNPYRPLTDEERAAFQQSVDNLYDDFVAHVSEERGIPEGTIREDIGALIFDNDQAQALGMIDATATLQEAYAELARLAELAPERYQVVEVKGDDSLFGALFETDVDPARAEALLEHAPGVCLPKGTALMFFGDPSSLCWR